MWQALGLPESSIQDTRVVGIHGKINSSRSIAAEQDLLPGCAAIPRAIDAAFCIRTMGVSKCRDIHQVGISRVDTYPGNVTRIFQSQVLPGCAAVNRFIDSISMRDVTTN